MTKVLKIFTLSILGICFLKYGIYASELSIIDETEEYKLNPIKMVEKQDLNIANVQESSELCKGKAFKEWVQKIEQEWAQKHENYHDKLMVLAPFVAVEAMLLKNAVNLSLPEVAVSLVGGWLLADLISGGVHYFFDYFPIKSKDYQSLSFLEERALMVFQGHHYFPKRVTEFSYWFLTKDTYLLTLSFLASGVIFGCYDYDISASLLGITALVGTQTAYVHALSHGKHADNRLVKFLQKTGLIISPKVHNGHHKDPEHASDYCLFNGHMNWVLDSFISVGRSSYKFFRNWSGAMPTKKKSD